MSNTITLPSAKEMLQKLEEVNPTSHLKENFYPLLGRHSGKSLSADELAELFLQAIFKYANGFPQLESFLIHNAEPFIAAIASDRQLAEDVHDAFVAKVMLTPRRMP